MQSGQVSKKEKGSLFTRFSANNKKRGIILKKSDSSQGGGGSGSVSIPLW